MYCFLEAIGMQAPESSAKAATAAPALQESPKVAVPSEAQLGPDIDTVLRWSVCDGL